jgi:hypothetical protein
VSRYEFARRNDGTAVLYDSDVRSAHRATEHLGGDVRVARAVREAAERRLVELARQASFEFSRSMSDSLQFVCQRNPELLRLSRARIAADDAADIGTY